jgi:hypothetical protein
VPPCIVDRELSIEARMALMHDAGCATVSAVRLTSKSKLQRGIQSACRWVRCEQVLWYVIHDSL